MATAAEKRVLMPSDLLYFLTFALGMGAFWVSGRAGRLVPASNDATLHTISSLGVTVLVFAGIMAVYAFIVTRQLKAVLVATLVAAVLGLVTAQAIVAVVAPHVTTTQQVGLLSFVLYFCYGFIYVGALALGRKIAK